MSPVATQELQYVYTHDTGDTRQVKKVHFFYLKNPLFKGDAKKSYIAILVGSDAHGYWAR